MTYRLQKSTNGEITFFRRGIVQNASVLLKKTKCLIRRFAFRFLKFRPTEAMHICWQDLPGQLPCSFLEFSKEVLEEQEAEPKAGRIRGWWAAGSHFWVRGKAGWGAGVGGLLSCLCSLPPPQPEKGTKSQTETHPPRREQNQHWRAEKLQIPLGFS